MKTFIALLFSVLLTSCPSKQMEQDSSDVILSSIYKGNLSGSGNEGFQKENLIITSKKEWKSFLAKTQIANFFDTKIDFSKNIVLVSIDDRRNTGGFSIEIVKPEVKNNKLQVTIVSKGPKPTDMVTMALTQPIHLVRIPKTNKEIVFVTE